MQTNEVLQHLNDHTRSLELEEKGSVPHVHDEHMLCQRKDRSLKRSRECHDDFGPILVRVRDPELKEKRANTGLEGEGGGGDSGVQDHVWTDPSSGLVDEHEPDS